MDVVYVIQHDQTKQIYFGVTKNLQKRLFQHNARMQKATSRRSGKWILIYAEAYRDKADAYQREKRWY